MKKNYFLLLGLLSSVLFFPAQGMLVNTILWDSQGDECHIAKLNQDSVLTIADHSYNVCDIKSLKTTCKWAYEKVYISDVFLDQQFLDKKCENFSFAGACANSSLCLKMLRRLAYEHDQLTNNFLHFTHQKKMRLCTPGFSRKFNLISEGINNLWEKYPGKSCLGKQIKDCLPLLVETQDPDIAKRYEFLQRYIGRHDKYAHNLDIELVKQVLLESNKFGKKSIGLLSCILELGDNKLVHIFLNKVDKEQLGNCGLKFWMEVFINLAGWRQHEALSYFIQNNIEKNERKEFFKFHTPYILTWFLSDTKNFLCQTHIDRFEYEKDRFHRTFDLLLENSCNINKLSGEGLLHHVCSAQDTQCSWNMIDVVKKLLLHGVNVNATNHSSETVLFRVCKKSSQESLALIKLLIDNKANINAIDNVGDTPLHAAVGKNHLEVVRLLLENDANPNIRNNNGDTPLHCIFSKTVPAMIQLFYQYKADFNIRNQQERVPLQRENLREDTINALRSCGAYIPMSTITKKIILGCSVLFISAAITYLILK